MKHYKHILFLIFICIISSKIAYSSEFNITNYKLNNKNSVEVLKILFFGYIRSTHDNFIDYPLYSNLQDQLSGTIPIFSSIYYDSTKLSCNSKRARLLINEHLLSSIKSRNPDIVIIYNMYFLAPIVVNYLDTNYKNRYFTIGYEKKQDFDIHLNITFDDFINFLDAANYKYDDIYFLIDVFSNCGTYDAIIDYYDFNLIKISKLSELRSLLINSGKEDTHSIFINNLSLVLVDTTGNVIHEERILNEFLRYSVNNPWVNIKSYDSAFKSYTFDMTWDYKNIFNALDSLIVSSYYDLIDSNTSVNLEFVSKLNVNIGNMHRFGIVDEYFLHSISKYLKYFDKVH